MNPFADYVPERTSYQGLEGDFWLSIEDAQLTQSRAGAPMFKITFSVLGKKTKVFHYIVKNEWFNKKITEFFDAFGIECGQFDPILWQGHAGAGKLRPQASDTQYTEVHYFYNPIKAQNIPLPDGVMMPTPMTVGSLDTLSPEQENHLPF